jgi:hypothetical protein
MKGYVKPDRPKLGICFICNQPCEAYCHRECALAFSMEEHRLIEVAKDQALKSEKV